MQIAEWDQRYRTGQRGEEQTPTPLVERFAPDLKPGCAIDLACGAGRNSVYLAQLGWDVTAVDGSPAALELLARRAGEAGVAVKTAVRDLERDPSVIRSDAFDLVLCCYYLQRSLFPAILAGTREGGMVIAIVHIPEGGQEPNDKRAAPGELRQFFAGWEILYDYEGPPNDPAHQRYVAEIVARHQTAGSGRIDSTL